MYKYQYEIGVCSCETLHPLSTLSELTDKPILGQEFPCAGLFEFWDEDEAHDFDLIGGTILLRENKKPALRALFYFETTNLLKKAERAEVSDYISGQLLDGYGENGLEIEVDGHQITICLDPLEDGTLRKIGGPTKSSAKGRPVSLVRLIKANKTEEVKQWIAAGSPLNEPGKWNQTPLMVAIQQHQTEIAILLLDAGCDVHAEDDEGWTALHKAARQGKSQLCLQLIAKGADINHAVSRGKGMTALHWASNSGHEDIVEFLIACGADINARTQHGRTPLMYAGKPAIARLLLLSGADAKIKNNENRTATEEIIYQAGSYDPDGRSHQTARAIKRMTRHMWLYKLISKFRLR